MPHTATRRSSYQLREQDPEGGASRPQAVAQHASCERRQDHKRGFRPAASVDARGHRPQQSTLASTETQICAAAGWCRICRHPRSTGQPSNQEPSADRSMAQLHHQGQRQEEVRPGRDRDARPSGPRPQRPHRLVTASTAAGLGRLRQSCASSCFTLNLLRPHPLHNAARTPPGRQER